MRPGETVSVRLCRETVDFRKSIDGLAGLVEETLGLDPFNAALYVFTNRRRDKLKILYWDRSGFALGYNQPASHYTSSGLIRAS